MSQIFEVLLREVEAGVEVEGEVVAEEEAEVGDEEADDEDMLLFLQTCCYFCVARDERP